MSLVVSDPEKTYPTQNIVWDYFEASLAVANGLIFYAPIYKEYYYEALREFLADNVHYIELRTNLPKVKGHLLEMNAREETSCFVLLHINNMN